MSEALCDKFGQGVYWGPPDLMVLILGWWEVVIGVMVQTRLSEICDLLINGGDAAEIRLSGLDRRIQRCPLAGRQIRQRFSCRRR